MSTWHEEPPGDDNALPAEAKMNVVARDFAEIRSADALILVAPSGPARGGCWFEAGFAYALGKRVIIMGETPNFFALACERVAGASELVERVSA